LKKTFIVFAAVVLTPILVVSLLLASGEWRSIGQTEAGDKVSVSSVRVLKSNQRMALVRVEYKEPAKLPQGGPFVEMRARVRFNCASGSAAPPQCGITLATTADASSSARKPRTMMGSAKIRRADLPNWSARAFVSRASSRR